jgi:hypothetical protein
MVRYSLAQFQSRTKASNPYLTCDEPVINKLESIMDWQPNTILSIVVRKFGLTNIQNPLLIPFQISPPDNKEYH